MKLMRMCGLDDYLSFIDAKNDQFNLFSFHNANRETYQISVDYFDLF